MPLVSRNLPLLIVVPTLNSHLLLPRLIASLQQQTWPFWRLVFIDGNSGLEHRNWLQKCCGLEPRCTWFSQDSRFPGIFGAMSQGFAYASDGDWCLFWGSDDWAASSTVLSQLVSSIEISITQGRLPGLVVCSGRYVDRGTGVLRRSTLFKRHSFLTSSQFSRLLFFGYSPPHQATVFGPSAQMLLSHYDTKYKLSSDLNYFLRLSRFPSLFVECIDLELVRLSDGGISNLQTSNRLHEVYSAYFEAFGWLWFVPFLLRYVKRLSSLLGFRLSLVRSQSIST